MTFMIGVRRLMNANAILWLKPFARVWENTFDQSNRVTGSRIGTQVNIRDRVSIGGGATKPGPEPSKGARAIRPSAAAGARKCAHLTCDKVTAIFTTSTNQRSSLRI